MIDSRTLIRLSELHLSTEQMEGVLLILARYQKDLEEAEQSLAGQRALWAERTARYRARGGGQISPEMRQQVYERDRFVCVYCGATEDLTCDHVIPVSKQGPTTLENLATACRPCNSRKRDKERKQFARSADNGRTTDGQKLETKENTPIPLKENNINKNTPLSPQEPPDFEEFWEAYPPRSGSKDRKAAVKAFRAATKRETFATILAGAKAYYIHCLQGNKLNTEYVKQARTWLNADGWKEVYTGDPSQPNGHFKSPQPTETRAEYIARITGRN